MSRNDEQTNIRLPGELKEWLQQQAAAARRSLTAEIIVALEQYKAQRTQEATHAT